MPLLGVANELLQSIAENLEKEKDINAFAQTNKRNVPLDFSFGSVTTDMGPPWSSVVLECCDVVEVPSKMTMGRER